MKNKIKSILVMTFAAFLIGSAITISSSGDVEANADDEVCQYFSPYGQSCVGIVPVDCLCPVIITPEE